MNDPSSTHYKCSKCGKLTPAEQVRWADSCGILGRGCDFSHPYCGECKMESLVKELVIMRGLPSSGKSYRAKELAGSTGVILSTDEYFYKLVEPEKPNEYSFRPSHIGFAHKWNHVRAQKLIEEGHPLIIIDNTNTTPSEAKAYVQYAVPQGYTVRFEEPTSPWWLQHAPMLRNKREYKKELKEFALFLAKKSEESHNVPAWSLERMLWRWVPDITVEMVLASADL